MYFFFFYRFGSSCTFAHGIREVRPVLRHPRYKTDLCRTYHGAGYCQYGARCHFVHDPEEAARVTFVRELGPYTLPDGANTMFALPENSNASSKVLILSNLQRLHAYKIMEEKFGLLNTSGDIDHLNSLGTLSTESNPISSDMFNLGQDSLLGMSSKLQPLENICDSSLDEPDINSAKYHINVKSPGKGNGQTWRLPPHGDDCWDREPEFCTQNSIADLNVINTSSPPGTDIWNLCGASPGKKSVIGNPMEVSRNLFIPTISELINLP